jgi:hypothetical protein
VATNDSNTPRTAVSVSRPPGTKPGDVMVASIVVNDTFPEVSAPPGWTRLRKDENRGSVRQDIFYKVASASDPSSFTWTINSGVRLMVGTIASYSGVDRAQPFDDHAADIGGGTALTTPSVTTSSAGAMLLALVAVRSDGSISPPAGMTERAEAGSTVPTDRSIITEWSDDLAGARGATGKRTAVARAGGPYIAALLALRPAP